MKGDFSRWTFNPDNQFTRVLMQQGRVQLDADWNEQVAILLHTMRQMVSDMMGPHGTWDEAAFKVEKEDDKYQVNQKGRYYAGGVLVDAKEEKPYEITVNGNTLVYLDVWERHLTYVEADEANQPGLREVALKGADTTTRATVAWRVRTGSVPLDVDVAAMRKAQTDWGTLAASLTTKEGELIKAENSNAISPGFSGLTMLETDLEGQISNLVGSLNTFIDGVNDTIPENSIIGNENDPSVRDLITQLDNLLSAIKGKLDIPEESISQPTSGYDSKDDNKKIEQLVTRMNLLVDIKKLRIQIEQATEILSTGIYKIEESAFDNIATGKLKAATNGGEVSNADNDSCTIPPDAAYTGPENQLYRVEIHQGSGVDKNNKPLPETFKWSRDNGTAIFPVDPQSIVVSGQELTLNLTNLGRDTEVGLAVEDWVELTHDDLVEALTPGRMFEVTKVDTITGTVTLKASDEPKLEPPEDPKHPILRRWDQGSDAIQVKVKDDDYSHSLENGIHIQFDDSGTYRTGDYWLIPARTATRNIEWPTENNGFIEPHGIQHYYAPLAIISGDEIIDCRRVFEQLGRPVLPQPETAPIHSG